MLRRVGRGRQHRDAGPQVCNLWEEQGWPGLARSFDEELTGADLQDPKLKKWWAKASEFRSGGVDRLLEPAPWSPTIEDHMAAGTRAGAVIHEIVPVRPGAAGDFVEAGQSVGRAGLRRARLGASRGVHHRDEKRRRGDRVVGGAPTTRRGHGPRPPNIGGPLVEWKREARRLATGWERVLLAQRTAVPLHHRTPAPAQRSRRLGGVMNGGRA